MYIIQDYDRENNGSYITLAITKKQAIRIANKKIDKILKSYGITEKEIKENEDYDTYINREKGELNIENYGSIEIMKAPIQGWIGGYILNEKN